jgi:hypothetical protein
VILLEARAAQGKSGSRPSKAAQKIALNDKNLEHTPMMQQYGFFGSKCLFLLRDLAFPA